MGLVLFTGELLGLGFGLGLGKLVWEVLVISVFHMLSGQILMYHKF